MFPAHTQSVSGGVVDTNVPGSTAWHYNQNPVNKCIIQQIVLSD